MSKVSRQLKALRADRDLYERKVEAAIGPAVRHFWLTKLNAVDRQISALSQSGGV